MSTEVAHIRTQLKTLEPEFASLLPDSVSPEAFSRVVLTALQNDPELVKADQRSLFSACMKAAEDQLVPDGDRAALVAFKGKVTYMRMMRGLIEKIYETGLVDDIDIITVRQGDVFEIQQGTAPNLHHVPKIPSAADAAVIGVYSIMHLKSGRPSFHFMETAEINKIRDGYGNTSDWSPWTKRWEAMAGKTVLRQHCKTKSLRGHFKHLFEDHDQYFDVDRKPLDVTPQQQQDTGIQGAKKLLGENSNA